jgi:hypothetical protein
MMATGLVLREVPLLCGDEPPAVRGRAPRWSDKKTGSESQPPPPFFLLSEAQVQSFETEPASG